MSQSPSDRPEKEDPLDRPPGEPAEEILKTDLPQTDSIARDQTIELTPSVELSGNREPDDAEPPEDASDGAQSLMRSRQIDRTISSAQFMTPDAAFWGNVAEQSGSAASSLPPAIERSLSETKLNLRGREIAPEQSPPEVAATADYRLVRMLGKGGMGNVYAARQGSLDRVVALKVIKPLEGMKRTKLELKGDLEKIEKQRRLQFISEAVVTGDLEHPNIVPIHDIAIAGDNTLFYAMRRVSGTPWSKSIAEKSRDENLEILLKVCDAVGFAHTRGVVHRDIKPENIMLGEFGVVTVMDWGLALAQPGFEKREAVFQSTGLGGSPAYMAPEMATGPVQRIGPASDVYLLGATLFQIITGCAPHFGQNIRDCLRAVAANEICKVRADERGELLDVAMRAMATEPEDRFADVRSFQDAIRQYRSHSESIALTSKADEDLRRGEATGNYADFSRALFGFEEALTLWGGNQRAAKGVEKAEIQYAEAAYRNGDFDLGLSLLGADNVDHQALIEKLKEGQRERRSRQTRLTWLYRGVAAMLAFILIGGAVAIYAIDQSAKEARSARSHAERSAIIANDKTKEAERSLELAKLQKEEADRQRQNASDNAREALDNLDLAVLKMSEADMQRLLAESNARTAEEKTREAARQALSASKSEQEAKRQQAIAYQAREKSDYESYVSRIGLVKARVEQNEFADARRILNRLKEERGQERLGWEWRWLSKQTRQSRSELSAQAGVVDLAISQASRRAIWLLEDGAIFSSSVSTSGSLAGEPVTSLDDAPATAVAVSDDPRQVAVATANGTIEIWDHGFSERFNGFATPAATITALKYAPGGWLLSAADDRSVRLWDPATGQQLAVCWHGGPLADIAVAHGGSGDKLLVIAAVAEPLSGYAACWELTPPEGVDAQSNPWSVRELGAFRGHRGPVLSVALSPAGELAASGDARGECLLWRPDEAEQIDYRSAIAAALKPLSDAAVNDLSRSRPRAPSIPSPPPDTGAPGGVTQRFLRLSDRSRQAPDAEASWADNADVSPTPSAHRDAVRSLAFAPGGESLLSGADDYTLKLWAVERGDLQETFRGHGGWVRRVGFIQGDDPIHPLVISGSSDATIRIWERHRLASESTEIFADQSGSHVKPHQDAISTVRFDSTGTLVVSASRDQTARVMRLDKDRQIFSQVAVLRDDEEEQSVLREGSSFVALSAALDRLGKRLYVASADAVVRVWDVRHATQIGQLDATGLNDTLALTPDGRFLVTLSSDPDVSCILWAFPPGANFSPRIVREFRGHPQAVTALAISPDGRTVFSGDRGGLGILWDVADEQDKGRRLDQNRGFRINAATFSHDGGELWIAADDHQLTRVQVASGETLSQFSHHGPVTQLSLSADARYAVTLSEQSLARSLITRVTLWDLATGEQRVVHSRQRAHEDASSSAARSPRSRSGRIVSASFGSTPSRVILGLEGEPNQPSSVGVWDIRSSGAAEPAAGFEMPPSLSALTAAIPLATDAMITLNGEAAILWDLPSQSHTKSYRTNGTLTQASFSSDGRFVATVGPSVKIWDLATGRSAYKLELPHEGPVHAAQFSPAAGSFNLVTAGQDGVVRLWNWQPAAKEIEAVRQWELSGPRRPIRCVTFSPDEQWLLAVGDQGVVRVLRTDGEGPESIYDLADGVGLTSAAFRADSHWFAVGGTDSEVRLWPTVAARQAIPEPILLQGHADRIEDVCFLEDGSEELRVITASRDKSARVWDPRIGSDDLLGREILALRRHTLGVTGVDVSPDGQSVITAGADASLVLWPADPSPETPSEDL